MPLFSSDEESSSEDEEKRQELIKLKREEDLAKKKRRRELEAANEAKWFAKPPKIEKLTLEQHLQREAFLVPVDQKAEFNQCITDVVNHFQSSSSNFVEEMEGITQDSQLVKFIKKAHKKITTRAVDEEPENLRLHSLLERYQKEVVSALKKMTKIPANEDKLEYKYADVFYEARTTILNNILLEEMRKEEEEKKEARREREKMEKDICDELTRDFVRSCRIGTNSDDFSGDALAQELANLTFRDLQLEDPEEMDRPISPVFPEFSAAALAEIDQIASRVKVPSTSRNLPGAVQEASDNESDDDNSSDAENAEYFMLMPFIESSSVQEESETADVVVKDETETVDEHLEELPEEPPVEEGLPEERLLEEELSEEDKARNTLIRGEDHSNLDKFFVEEDVDVDEEEIAGQDAAAIRHFIRKECVVIQKKQDSSFAMDDTSEQSELLRNWHERRRKNINKVTGKKVRIEPFDSPANKMRIYLKPNCALSALVEHDQDDGPTLEYKDYAMKDGWHELVRRRTKFPLIVREQSLNPYTGARKSELVQRLTFPTEEWMIGYKGNLLGRFWFLRNPEYDDYLMEKRRYDSNMKKLRMFHGFRSEKGVLRQYTQEELVEQFASNWRSMKLLRQGYFRQVQKIDERSQMKNVLLLTDWRLVHLHNLSVKNAVVRYMPTQIGPEFFDALEVFLTSLLLNVNLEIDTLIFAFGGAPHFNIEVFKKFWTKLTVLTLKSVDVHWFAQDWLDGLPATPEQHEKLEKFNSNVSLYIETMRKAGNKNYHYYNIRKLHNIPYQPAHNVPEPDTLALEPLYNIYVRHFVNHCNVFTNSCFFVTTNRRFDDHPEKNNLKPTTSIVQSGQGDEGENDEMY